MAPFSTQQRETICALASAPGEGAVGILRISGAVAHELLQGLGAKPLRPRRLQRRLLRHPEDGRRLDEVLACWMPGPRSYTGEDVVEVFGHGGELNMAQLLEACVAAGARRAEPGEFTRRAFLNGRLDLAQAEAVASIIVARSERALNNAQALLGGALGRELAKVREAIVSVAAELEAAIDFSDDVDDAEEDRVALLAGLEAARAPLVALIGDGSAGDYLEGISVALVGPVNVGKSSLFNALVGQRRALVSTQAGTTRDYLEAELSWSGARVTLVDTAGERDPDDMGELERAGWELAAERLRSCDVQLRLVDASEPRQGGGELPSRASGARGARELVVVTKVDALDEGCGAGDRGELAGIWGPGAVLTSAAKGEGLDDLRQRVIEMTLGQGSGAESVLVTRERQRETLRAALSMLDASAEAVSGGLPPELCVEHLRLALDALGEVTGETYREDILDTVFSRFCIGK